MRCVRVQGRPLALPRARRSTHARWLHYDSAHFVRLTPTGEDAMVPPGLDAPEQRVRQK